MLSSVLKTGSATTEIAGKALHQIKDLEAYEEACLFQKGFRCPYLVAPNG